MDNELPNNGGSSLHLHQFWAENTEAWFTIAETRFQIKRVDNQQEMFDHIGVTNVKMCVRICFNNDE